MKRGVPRPEANALALKPGGKLTRSSWAEASAGRTASPRSDAAHLTTVLDGMFRENNIPIL